MSNAYKDRKIVCMVSENLEMWQAMNVVGHLAVGLGANKDIALMGRDILVDASKVEHKGIARYGFIIKKGTSKSIREVIKLAREAASVTMVDFPREMLETSSDDELADAIAKKGEGEFEYLGVIMYGPSADVNVLTKDFVLWS